VKYVRFGNNLRYMSFVYRKLFPNRTYFTNGSNKKQRIVSYYPWFHQIIARFIAHCCTILFIKIDKVYHNILYYCFVLHKILFCLIDHCLHQQELEGSRTGRRAAPGPGIGHDCTAGRWIGHDCTGRAIMYYTMWYFAQYNDLYIKQFSCNIYSYYIVQLLKQYCTIHTTLYINNIYVRYLNQ